MRGGANRAWTPAPGGRLGAGIRTLLLAPCLLGLPGLAAPAAGATWEVNSEQVPSPQANATLGISLHPAAAGPDGVVHLTYQNRVGDEEQFIVYVNRQKDGTWSTPISLSEPGLNSNNPAVSLDPSGGLHVVWSENSSNGDVVYRRRTPDGEWLDAQILSPSPGFSRRPLVAADAFGRIHVAWLDGRSGLPQILYCVNEPGSPWEDPRVISREFGLPDDVTLVADPVGGTHLAWSDRVGVDQRGRPIHDLFYLHVAPGQEETAEPVRLVTGPSRSSSPYLAVTSDSAVHLVWLDTRDAQGAYDSEIYYRRFLPGIGWGKSKRFSYDLSHHGRPVIIEGSGGTLNVAWEDYRAGNPEIYYRQITHETGWDPQGTRLTDDPSSSQTPFLVTLEDGDMVLFWTDAVGSGDFRIYARDGNVFSTPQ